MRQPQQSGSGLITSFVLPKSYPAPDELLCQGPSIEDQRQQPQVVNSAGASITFNQQQSLKGGGSEQARRRLLNAVIEKFIASVQAMKR